MFRFCDKHAQKSIYNKTHPETEKIPFVTDSGRLRCTRCAVEWVPPSFFINPDGSDTTGLWEDNDKAPKEKTFRGQEYMQIPKNCPQCRSPYWMVERTRGKWKASRYNIAARK